MKKKIKLEDIILDAFLECIREDHIKSREIAILTNQKVINPHFWQQGKFISIDYIDKYNNIIYRETQPGTNEGDDNHIIGIAFPYIDYKPYHDKWVKLLNREKNLNELVGENI